MRVAARIVSVVAALIGIAWVAVSPGFESILTCLGGLVACLGSLIEGRKPDEAQPEIDLSPIARELLEEIDSSTKSSMKGISLMMVDSVVGLYRPYIWSNAVNGPIESRFSDISDVVCAVHELEKRGFLAFISQSIEITVTIQKNRKTTIDVQSWHA
jgi:hypothetical protein